MSRPRKETRTDIEILFDTFSSLPVYDQKMSLKVMERLVIERDKDEQRAKEKPSA